MSDSERFRELIKLEGIEYASRFASKINYSNVNLTNYLSGRTKAPTGELIMLVHKHYPKWNLRYWFFGEGNPILEEGQIGVIKEAEKDGKRVQQLIDIMEHLKAKGKIVNLIS